MRHRGKWVALLVDGEVRAVIPLDENTAEGRFQTRLLQDHLKAPNLAAYLSTGPLPLEIIYKPEAPSWMPSNVNE